MKTYRKIAMAVLLFSSLTAIHPAAEEGTGSAGNQNVTELRARYHELRTKAAQGNPSALSDLINLILEKGPDLEMDIRVVIKQVKDILRPLAAQGDTHAQELIDQRIFPDELLDGSSTEGETSKDLVWQTTSEDTEDPKTSIDPEGIPSISDVKNQTCLKCGKLSQEELSRCSRCKTARYCGKECQKADWKRHKKECIPAETIHSTHAIDENPNSCREHLPTVHVCSSSELCPPENQAALAQDLMENWEERGLTLKEALSIAKGLLESAIDQGYIKAKNDLGLLIMKYWKELGHKSEADGFRQAEAHFRHLANRGEADGQINLGVLLEKHWEILGISRKKTITEAQNLYKKARKQKHPHALKYLGILTSKHWEVLEMEKMEAIKKIIGYFELAAKQNHPCPLHTLGQLFEFHGVKLGMSLKKAIRKAKYYYEKAIEQEDFSPLIELAVLIKEHWEVLDIPFQEAIHKAKKYYEKAIEHELENPLALNNLGYLIEKHWDVLGMPWEEAMKEALGLYKQGALKNNHFAQLNCTYLSKKASSQHQKWYSKLPNDVPKTYGEQDPERMRNILRKLRCKKTCIYCFEVSEKKLNRCNGCKIARYCCPDCQKADWRRHKQECTSKKA